MPRGKGPGPSVKDPKRYEALRDDGLTKQKAARIANSDPKEMARHRRHSGGYDEWSKDDLMAKARDIDIKGRSTMTKAELVQALRKGE
ncbi:MAG: Rho termination factor [Chloroflexi bacterium]|nr:Rho termination factor [Chloroflexota bacterium]